VQAGSWFPKTLLELRSGLCLKRRACILYGWPHNTWLSPLEIDGHARFVTSLVAQGSFTHPSASNANRSAAGLIVDTELEATKNRNLVILSRKEKPKC
jgi:hypothetical protein